MGYESRVCEIICSKTTHFNCVQIHSEWFINIKETMNDTLNEQVSLSLIDRAWRSIKCEENLKESVLFGFSQCEVCYKNMVLPSE